MANNSSLSFNIDTDDYQTFIEILRTELSQSTSHGIPVLMPQSDPLSWLDVQLTAGDHSIILRIERRNLYVRGYATDNDARFWEFADSSLIPGSRSLGYFGSYVGARGLTSTARVEREDLPLGYSPLQNAISNLTVINNPDAEQERSARQLLTIIQMVAEAARMQSIAEHIVQNWWNSQPITLQMVRLENAWRTFSSAVQRADYPLWTPTTPLPDVPNPNWVNIWTVGQATAAIGILLHHQRTQRVTRAVTEYSVTQSSHIRTLVSIEYVRVNNIDGEDPGQLYGTVTVTDCWGSHAVYERSSDNPESKGPGEYATLTGPSTAISGEDAFTISVSLWDHDTLSPEDEIAKGDIVWDPRKDSSYDNPLQADVWGKYGNVTVGYSVLREALSATVDVVLINGDGESPADVYGTIKASQFGSSTTLFEKAKGEYVEVDPQESIPLTRDAVPASVNSHLTIAADLWDHDTVSTDDQIALGSVQFSPTIGTQKKNISGEYGEVQVSITCG